MKKVFVGHPRSAELSRSERRLVVSREINEDDEGQLLESGTEQALDAEYDFQESPLPWERDYDFEEDLPEVSDKHDDDPMHSRFDEPAPFIFQHMSDE